MEVGVGVVPGGGPMARLSHLVGRGRALEILLVADDLDGPRAEQCGYVNRLIADDQLDAEVEAIARPSALFKRACIDLSGQPPGGRLRTVGSQLPRKALAKS